MKSHEVPSGARNSTDVVHYCAPCFNGSVPVSFPDHVATYSVRAPSAGA